MAEPDKYLKGSPFQKLAILFGAILSSLIVAIVFFVIAVEGFMSGDTRYYPYTIPIPVYWTIAMEIALIGYLAVALHRVHHQTDAYYFEPGVEYIDLYNTSPRQCSLCGKHPVSKKYHLKVVHGLKIWTNAKVKHYFKNCGCEVCNRRGDIGFWPAM